MAGGPNTPALAAAVSNAGAVGSFGFAYSSPARISEDLNAARSLTKGPLNANFFVFPDVNLPSDCAQACALAALQQLGGAQSIDLGIPKSPFVPDLAHMLEAVWENSPDILTFHFGIPDDSVIRFAQDRGIAVGVSATCVAEAERIAVAGADFIVAQGTEAGGHRGTFEPDGDDEHLACLELVRQIVQSMSLPVVAAGGIMDGKDIHLAIQAGAVAAQCGTAFLACDESGASSAHKEFLQFEGHRGTESTRAFSGRSARGIRNTFIEEMRGQPVLPFPIQNTMTGPLRKRAGEYNDGEHQSLWAGSEYARTRAMPASELVRQLREELERAQSSVPFEGAVIA